MKLTIKIHDKVPFIVRDGFNFDSREIDNYLSYCGAGKGIGDTIVPETMHGQRVSVACHVHDDMWSNANGSLHDFMLSNAIFLFNVLMVILHRSNKFMVYLRGVRALTYFFAVTTAGKKHYRWENGEK